jgi:putative spermidine/putrescine transport system permease protein
MQTRRPSPWREAALGLALALPPFAVVVLLVIVPALQAVTFSLGQVPQDNASYSTGMHLVVSPAPTLRVYRELLATPTFRQDSGLTARVTVASVALVLVVGYVLALYVRFGDGRLPGLVRTLYLTPMFVPIVIASYALITFYTQRGELQTILGHLGIGYVPVIYYPSGIIIGQLWANIPFAVLMLGSGLDAISQELIEAARDVGAGAPRILWRIVLPLNLVPTLIVATFSFIGVVGSFTIPFLLGPNAPQMLGVAMQAYFTAYQQPQAAAAMAVMAFLACAVAGGLYVWGTSRTGRGVA